MTKIDRNIATWFLAASASRRGQPWRVDAEGPAATCTADPTEQVVQVEQVEQMVQVVQVKRAEQA
ncbi:hypothetical protein [Glaciihabitans tibetensis]|uniref:hypothetical protein n=1 Tax=Glaciihabitans tibetensis TaxID=1266600 RepID=UPI0011B210FF|nr:hypothetical protein [Glaciihabitans tibetensis]